MTARTKDKNCRKCNTYKSISLFRKTKNGTPRYICKLCEAAYKKEWRNKNKESYQSYHKNYSKSLSGKYSRYKFDAKKRGYVFELDLKQFKDYWKAPCTYCGASIETVGLDRKANSGGYTAENVTSCCTICNKAKGSRSYNEWLRWLQDIRDHHTTKNKKSY